MSYGVHGVILCVFLVWPEAFGQKRLARRNGWPELVIGIGLFEGVYDLRV